MDTKTIAILVGIGAVVIYAIYKLAPTTTQEIQTLVPVGRRESAPDMDEQIFRSSQLGAFEKLLDLGKSQTESTTALGLEGIRSGAQERALELQSSTAISLQELQNLLETGLAEIQGETALGLGSQQLELGREQVSGQLEAIRIMGANRFQELQQQLQAVTQAGYDYRKQSLERQGTILNAILSAGGNQPAYSYQGAFGGPRGPGFFNQGGGFDTITKGISRFFGF